MKSTMIKKGVVLLSFFLLGLVVAEVLFYQKLDRSFLFESKKSMSISPSPQPDSTNNPENSTPDEATLKTIMDDVRPLLASNIDAKTEFTVEYQGRLQNVFFDFQSKTDPDLIIPLAVIIKPNGKDTKEMEIDFTANDLKTAPLIDDVGKKVDYKTLKVGQILTIRSTYDFKDNKTEPTLEMQVSSVAK